MDKPKLPSRAFYSGLTSNPVGADAPGGPLDLRAIEAYASKPGERAGDGTILRLVAALRETRAALTDGPPLITSLNAIRPDASGGPAKMITWFAAAFAWSERAAAVLASVRDE